jgi:hypothetical protein
VARATVGLDEALVGHAHPEVLDQLPAAEQELLGAREVGRVDRARDDLAQIVLDHLQLLLGDVEVGRALGRIVPHHLARLLDA